MKTTEIKGRPYVEVNERLKYFRSEPKYKGFSLESEIVLLENGVITIKAIIKDETGRTIATGLAQEKESSSFINKTSFVENCETSAWGRALGNLGIGIDTSVASAEEVENAILNQKPNEENNDIDLIEGLKACDTIANLIQYKSLHLHQVSDKAKFLKVFAEVTNQIKKTA